MKPVLALYLPTLGHLLASMMLLGVAFAVLLGCAYRLQLPIYGAAVAMIAGLAAALLPDVLSLDYESLASHYDDVREMTGSSTSDFMLALTGYMEVGRGRIVAFAGMVGGLLVYLGIRHVRPPAPRTLADSSANTE